MVYSHGHTQGLVCLFVFLQLSPANITEPGPGLHQLYPAFEKLQE